MTEPHDVDTEERVAKAIAGPGRAAMWERLPHSTKLLYRQQARAAIAELREGSDE